ncbi:ectoine synthase [Mesorhizobium sp.]|uniref:ectoine synthase n=1 Tax=Mesorhizobium sp. TaxID=1871066 RepID=UPI0025FBCC46|nr:ectoine synthase [Mesorhizobium sp.]
MYCVSGTGSVQDPQSDEVRVVRPIIIYAFDKHDAHLLCAETELVLACVFIRPLGGREVHDESGDLMSPEEVQSTSTSRVFDVSRSARRSSF